MGVGDGTKPTVYGQKPWINDDRLTPNEAYFQNVDAVVQIARENSVVISMTLYHQRYRKCITGENGRAWAKYCFTKAYLIFSFSQQAQQFSQLF
jgi:UDP-2,3-diacylglucosamine pyrophosphatase LpxH